MRTLQHILDINQFVLFIKEGKKSTHSSCPWWDECISSVESSIYADRTTTKDNLREKAKSYANNFILMQPENSDIDRDRFVEEIADEIEENLKDYKFDQRPPASVVAQIARTQIPMRPEERFIKLG